LPIPRDEAATTRWSEAAKREYQKIRLSAAVCGAPPGLMKRARAITPMMRIPTSVTGNAILEPEVSRADTSGSEADWGLLPPGPSPGAVLGNAALPELGTSGVTLVGTLVLGVTMFCVPAIADCDASSEACAGVVLARWAGDDGDVFETCVPATAAEPVSAVEVDAKGIEFELVAPGEVGTDVGALSDGGEI
jgi:hypothetical protein